MPSTLPFAPARKLPLLRAVSRSFYLSIRLLPQRLREPIAVAYLLARASDTIADTAKLPLLQRRLHLEALVRAIDGEPAARADAAALAASFAAQQQDAAEKALILALPECLAWLDGLAPADQADVREVLGKITRGQMLDIERFAVPGRGALASAQELDEYTYLVAGCVGEFWTKLCVRDLPGFSQLPTATMLELGRNYGMGLQLVNILRDRAADLAAGRGYLPGENGGDTQHWREQAALKLAAGMRYALAVNNRRVRAASALPALLGARTLSLLQSPAAQGGHVKVARAEVRSILLKLALGLAGRERLQSLFRQCTDGTIAP